MSNRRKISPPASVTAMARSYECGHCDSESGTPWFDGAIWHLSIHHDDECPVLNGHVSAVHAGARASASVATEIGKPILYVGLEDHEETHPGKEAS